MTFRLTDACRAAIADAANQRIERVVFRSMAIGDGLAVPGVDDGARPALRNERQRQDLTAVAGSAARIGVRASFAGGAGDQVWNATEVGLFAQVAAEPLFLAAYGAVGAGADPYAVVAPGVDAVIAATVNIDASEAAVAVTVTPSLTVEGPSLFTSLLDTPAALSPGALYRGNANGTALEAVTPAQLRAEMNFVAERQVHAGAGTEVVTGGTLRTVTITLASRSALMLRWALLLTRREFTNVPVVSARLTLRGPSGSVFVTEVTGTHGPLVLEPGAYTATLVLQTGSGTNNGFTISSDTTWIVLARLGGFIPFPVIAAP